MNDLVESLLGVLVLLAWVVGAVLAKGFWATLAAVVLPPYAWYVAVEWAMLRWGLL